MRLPIGVIALSSQEMTPASAHDPQPKLLKSHCSERVREYFAHHPLVVAMVGWLIILLAHRLVIKWIDDIDLLDLTRSEILFFTLLLVGGILFSIFFSQTIKRHNIRTEQKIEEINQKSDQLHSVGLLGLSRATAARDKTMSLHLRRVGLLSETLGRSLSKNPKYKDYITEQYLADLRLAAELHDVGRIGISDSVLCNPGGLTNAEYETMKMHVIIGGDIIAEMQRTLPFRSYYSLAKEVTYHHHQHWDGTGYPNVLKAEDGSDNDSYFIDNGVGEPLKGKEIPLSARIVAVTDAYDAMVSRRRYRDPLTHDEACSIINEKSGTHYDPDVVNAFNDVKDEMHRVVLEIRD